MPIKRYSPDMQSDPKGDWIEYDDYVTLQTETNELREKITELNEYILQLRIKKDNLQIRYDHLVENL